MQHPRKPTMTGEQASEDAIVPQPPNNAHSTTEDPDHERPGGMSGGLGETEPGEGSKQGPAPKTENTDLARP